MKNALLFFALFLCAFSATAQVTTTYFEGKDAFQSLPILRQSKSQSLSAKIMPPIDIGKQMEEEDSYLEGIDVPFRFGYEEEYVNGVSRKQKSELKNYNFLKLIKNEEYV